MLRYAMRNKSEYEIEEYQQKEREVIGICIIVFLVFCCIVLTVKLVAARHETIRAEGLLFKDFVATMDTIEGKETR